ncbi:MAG TPA: YHS domain-containing protein [Armatimonadaceae bacterium]|jgi:Cu+-exporting ATPase|nr:YHS domain-containing protein [Armatimonadaceae bacterium]
MKNIVAALAVAAAFGSAAYAQGNAPAAPKAAKKPVCPIMKHEVAKINPKMKSEYKGKSYYFCCAGCKPAFDKKSDAEKAKLAQYGVAEKKAAPKKS